MVNKKIKIIFERLSADRPNPRSELRFDNHFQLLIAVILSAQATDVSVNRVTPELFAAAPTPEKMLSLGEKRVQSYIKSIGLSNSKAKNIIKCCERLINQFNSIVPDDRDALESLAGVGRKTAGVILNVAFDKNEIPVDTHVFRVSNRIGLVKAKNPLETEKQLLQRVPKDYLNSAHHLLILHGRHICKARKPICESCVINDLCEFPDKISHG